MSVCPHTSKLPGILTRHRENLSVNGTALRSASTPYHAQWYSEQRLFLHSYKPGASDFASTLQLIDITADKVADSVAVTFNSTASTPAGFSRCPCTTCSKEMQIFLVGGESMQAIDIRSKKRLFIPHSAPVHALALYPSSLYSIFYLAGHQYLSLFTLDLRNQKEIPLLPKAAQVSRELALEVCPHLESETLMYTIQSERLFTVVGHHGHTNEKKDGFDTASTASLLSRVAKHPSETFTWLHSMLCYNGDLVAPHIVCSREGSRLALLNTTGTASECSSLDPTLRSNMVRKNISLNLASTISRASSAAAAQGVLAVAVDGGVYMTSTS